MWIKSQDNVELIKTEYIIVSQNEIKAETHSPGVFITIGKYSSHEKALKVLNMIQKAIEHNNSHQNARIGRPYFEYNVFQMPLDSDIPETYHLTDEDRIFLNASNK